MKAWVPAVVLLLFAGCAAPSDDVEGAMEVPEGAIPTAHGDSVVASAATQKLAAQGFLDPYLEVEPTGDVKEFDVWMDPEDVIEPYGDRQIFAFTFASGPDESGTVPGPEIRVTQGDTVRVTLHDPHNMEGHTMHWHGVDVPWRSDGVPFQTQGMHVSDATDGSVKSYTYEFVAKQPGTYWYHCVFAFPAHVDAGMFGALIVDPQDPESDLPYDRDEILFFHETDSQMFQAAGWTPANGQMDPNPSALPQNPFDAADSVRNQARSAPDIVGGVTGPLTGLYGTAVPPRDYYPAFSPHYRPEYDTFMINGKSYPETDPIKIQEGETLRLRMINAGQLHKSIHLHGHHMLVTHIDGYPLDHPHWEDTLSLAPGERKDVYVTGTNPGIWSLHDHSGGWRMGSLSANDYAFPGGMKTVLTYEGFTPPDQPEQPEGHGVTAGDLAVYAPSYQER